MNVLLTTGGLALLVLALVWLPLFAALAFDDHRQGHSFTWTCEQFALRRAG